MIYNSNGDVVKLVQITNELDDLPIGLYLVPEKVSNDELEENFKRANSQDEFDNQNNLGIVRIFVDEIYSTFP